MAYGQTSAGKTFTMMGWTDRYEHRGVIPRAIGQVFRRISEKSDTMIFNVRVSYFEIYNESIIDLLSNDASSTHAPKTPKTPRTPSQTQTKAEGTSGFRGLRELEALNEADALDYFFEGEMNRTMAVHQLNRYSTRYAYS